jgi:transketolase
MPCTELFDAQDAAYRDAVLPAGARRVAIEAGVSDGWWRYVGIDGAIIGLDRFGESAPAEQLFEHFGFTTDNVLAVARRLLG